MTKKTATELLEGAYALASADDNRIYYKDFAQSYDTDYAANLGYLYPEKIAQHYLELAGPTDRPIADIGCGTGLVAQALDVPKSDIHGFDISSHMLAKATQKDLYGNLFEIDLCAEFEEPQTYGAILSAGTFTHGHLGPKPLQGLLRLAEPNALFCIGVNLKHFTKQNFAATLTNLHAQGLISLPDLTTIPVYSDPNSAHGADKALVLSYRFTGGRA